MKCKSFLTLLISLLVALPVLAFGASAIARAQGSASNEADAPVGTSFSYQGQLKDASGPLTGSCDFQLGLWDALTAGTQTGATLTKTNQAVSEGLFTVLLDFGANAFNGSARWLEIAVRCPAGGGQYATLSPRQPLSPAPYALYSANADLLDGQHASAFASNAHNHWGQVWYGSGTGLTLSGNTGLNAGGTDYGVEGYASSSNGRGIYGSANATTGFTFGIYGGADSTSGTGVFGIAGASSGITNGVYGFTQSTSGTGVLGVANATTGSTFGVSGMVYATNGIGVYGWAYASSGNTNGVYGVSYSTGGRGITGYNNATSGTTYGVFGQADSTSGTGVYGGVYATHGVTTGVFGVSDSTDGRGVYGVANATTGSTFGVKGSAFSTSGSGVFGSAPATTGSTYGVQGWSSSTAGTGVFGVANATTGWTIGVSGTSASTTGTGVYGRATAASGTTYGVYGLSLSTAGVGIFGQADNGYGFGVEGYSISTVGTGVYGHVTSTSGAAAGVWGETESTDGWGVYGEASCYNCNYGVFSRGNLYVTGNFTVVGTKSATVETQDYGWVDLYSMESPRVLFEDVNTAQLVNGQAVVTIDPVFAQTVELTQTYQVFLTPGGDCSLYVSSKTPTAFTVSAQGGQTCSISFDYRIIAVRKGYANLRLEPAEDPEQVARLADPASVPPDQKVGDQP
jgi:hypothetical protein